MLWLITGGCGFIGANLIRRIARFNCTDRVRVLDNFSVETSNHLDASVGGGREHEVVGVQTDLIRGDIADPAILARAMQGVDVVVHLAARSGIAASLMDPGGDLMSNTVGTFNCLDAARTAKVKKFIFASSGAALGDKEPPLSESCVPVPISPYGAGKLACEGYCSAFRHSFGLSTSVLRFSNVYGPYSRHKVSVIAKYVCAALEGSPIIIYGDGRQTRDYLYVDDAAAAIMLCAQKETESPLFHVATGVETSLHQVVEMLKGLLEPRVGALKIEYRPARKGEVSRSFADSSKARAELGWEPVNHLDRGLAQTVEWYLGQTQ
jgi:UDP-glucose 4-epimerase